MEKDNIIEKIDLDLARKISFQQGSKYGILPFYEETGKVFILKSNDEEIKLQLIDFLFDKEVEYIKIEKILLYTLINDILKDFSGDIEETLIRDAIRMNASDIHFEPIGNFLNIRFRVNGDLILMRKIYLKEYLQIATRLKIRANMDITEKRVPQDGKLVINLGEIKYDCRLSTIPVINGEKIVLRILYKDKFTYDLNELTLTDSQKDTLKKIISVKNGIVLVNGPTGSGKSTTLYTILNYIKKGYINITTVEDPIEVVIEGINQINLNPKIGITFAKGLRAILRQDPDVIMLGEIRDEETAKMAIRAAITGHKVYSTIHTKSAKEVYLRLEEMGVQSYLVKDAIVGIVSQRLIKTLCDNCKSSTEVKNINGYNISIYKKVGCELCNGTGYKGRNLVASVLDITSNLREKLTNKEELIELSNSGMIENLNSLLIKGSIDYLDYLDFIEGEELNEYFN